MTDASQAPESKAGPEPSRAAFAFIFVTVLLDMIALGIVVPVLPKLIKAVMDGLAMLTFVKLFRWPVALSVVRRPRLQRSRAVMQLCTCRRRHRRG